MRFFNKHAFMSWDSDLDGLIGICANRPSDVKQDVSEGGPLANVGRCTNSHNDKCPFLLKELGIPYLLFYPFLFTSFWEDYELGKTIYYHDGSEWKKIPLGTEVYDQTYWANDYTYTDKAPLGFQEVDSDLCTWGELAHWLVAGRGLVRFPNGRVSRFKDFSADQWDLPVSNDYLVRRFDMTEWVLPYKRFINLD